MLLLLLPIHETDRRMDRRSTISSTLLCILCKQCQQGKVATELNMWWECSNRFMCKSFLTAAVQEQLNNNNNDRLTAFDPGQPG